jgi:hypothetical protein
MITTETIQKTVSKLFDSDRQPIPHRSNWISSLNDKCNRRLFYWRVNWDKAAPRDDGFLGTVKTGSELEGIIGRILSKIGEAADPPFRLVGQQIPTIDNTFEKLNISGKIDGLLQVFIENHWKTIGVWDTKTSDSNVHRSINTADDLNRYFWMQGYKAQLQLYALAHNLDMCYIGLVRKGNLYDIKIISFPLDFAYTESLLKKAEQINEAVKNNIPPEKINDPDECPDCPFNSFCCPDYTLGKDVKIIDSQELEIILTKLEELKPIAKEYANLEDERDSILIKGQTAICGKWIITWKQDKNEHWRKKIVCK